MRAARAAAVAPALALLLLFAAAFTVSPRPPAPVLPSWLALLSGGAGRAAVTAVELLQAFAAGIFAITLVILFALGLRERAARGRQETRRYAKPIRRLALALAALAAVMTLAPWAYGAYLSSVLGRSAVEGAPSPDAAPPAPAERPIEEAGEEASPEPQGAPTALVIALASGGVLAGVLAALAILRTGTGGRRRSGGISGDEAPVDAARGEAARHVGAARALLETGDSVRDAIIAAWAAMCDRLAPRAPGSRDGSLTPRELSALLGRHGAPGEALDTLTHAFELARYSDEPLPGSTRDDAARALAAIEARLAGTSGGEE